MAAGWEIGERIQGNILDDMQSTEDQTDKMVSLLQFRLLFGRCTYAEEEILHSDLLQVLNEHNLLSLRTGGWMNRQPREPPG
jgi:hypothetical protein